MEGDADEGVCNESAVTRRAAGFAAVDGGDRANSIPRELGAVKEAFCTVLGAEEEGAMRRGVRAVGTPLGDANEEGGGLRAALATLKRDGDAGTTPDDTKDGCGASVRCMVLYPSRLRTIMAVEIASPYKTAVLFSAIGETVALQRYRQRIDS